MQVFCLQRTHQEHLQIVLLHGSGVGMQIHFPFPTYKQSVLADGLKEAMDLGLTKAVGVCNYDAAQVEEMHTLLARHDIALATNQVSCLSVCCTYTKGQDFTICGIVFSGQGAGMMPLVIYCYILCARSH